MKSGSSESPRFLKQAHISGLFAIMAFAAIAFGTTHTATRVAVFLACAAVLTIALLQRQAAEGPLFLGPPVALLIAALGLTALQLIPLPASIVQALSPTAHGVFQSALGDYRRHALSLDPPATLRELAKLAAYAAFYLAAVAYATRHKRRLWLMGGVVGVCTLVAGVALFQLLAGTDKVLFVYVPEQQFTATVARGSFVNPNHFGALMTLGAPCALIIALQQSHLRLPAAAAVLTMNVACFLSLGRASIVTIVLAQGLALLLGRPSNGLRARLQAWRPVLTAVVLIGTAATVAVIFDLGRLRSVWDHTSIAELNDPGSKYMAWRQALGLLATYPLTGVGRGALEQAFATVASNAGQVRYPWLENAYLQAFVDWGLPGGLVLAALGVWIFVSAVRRLRHDPLLMGPLAALVGLALHEVVDFSIELPGVALPALALLAVLHGRREGEPQRWSISLRPRPAMLLAPVVAAVLALGQGHSRARDAETEGKQLAAVARDASVPTEMVIARGQAAWNRHPADYYLPLTVAERLVPERHPQAVRWLNAAMVLAPSQPLPHQLAAELMASVGRKQQALLEFRAALERMPEGRLLWPSVARWYPGLEDLLAATPDRHLQQLADWLGVARRLNDAKRVLERAYELQPRDRRVLTALVRTQLQHGEAQRALDHARRLTQLERSQTAQLLEVRASVAVGDLANAASILDGADLSGHADHTELEIALANAYARAGNIDGARKRLAKVPADSLDPESRNRVYEARAAIERQAGNEHQANWELQQRSPLEGKSASPSPSPSPSPDP